MNSVLIGFYTAVVASLAALPVAILAVRYGRFLFSHNGSLNDWPATKLAAAVPPERLVQLEAPTDSALLWALVAGALARRRPEGAT